MADPKKALETNVPGNFFVDLTCINCDTCRQLAPTTFAENGDYSAVAHQPIGAEEERAAMRALLCCPTGSIGTRKQNNAKEVMSDLPLPITDDIFYCGFNSPNSYGGNSFFLKHADGNWLIDSPKFLPHLLEKFRSLGGIKYIFLTHRDDVADASRFAEKFGAKRIIHRHDLSAEPKSEIVIDGREPIKMGDDFRIIPSPGHTAGHMLLLHKETALFTGDHLAYDRESRRLMAYRSVCWYSWEEQTKSMESLLDYSFEWVLAGHGDRVHLPRQTMKNELARLVERMKLPPHLGDFA